MNAQHHLHKFQTLNVRSQSRPTPRGFLPSQVDAVLDAPLPLLRARRRVLRHSVSRHSISRHSVLRHVSHVTGSHVMHLMSQHLTSCVSQHGDACPSILCYVSHHSISRHIILHCTFHIGHVTSHISHHGVSRHVSHVMGSHIKHLMSRGLKSQRLTSQRLTSLRLTSQRLTSQRLMSLRLMSQRLMSWRLTSQRLTSLRLTSHISRLTSHLVIARVLRHVEHEQQPRRAQQATLPLQLPRVALVQVAMATRDAHMQRRNATRRVLHGRRVEAQHRHLVVMEGNIFWDTSQARRRSLPSFFQGVR